MFDTKVFPSGTVKVNRSHPLAVGLVGWWPLATDGRDMLERYPVSMTGMKPVPSHGGPAMNFSGSSFGQLNALPAISTTFSISAWAYPTNLNQGSSGGGSGGTILESNNDGLTSGWDFGLEFSTNKIWFWPAGSADVRSTGSITLNQWNHVGMTVTGTAVSLYINGALDSAQTSGSAPQSYSYLRIAHQSHCTGYFVGNLRDIRLYNRVLTAAEMRRLYMEPYSILEPASRHVMPNNSIRVLPD